MYLFIIYCCKSITQTHGIDGGNNTGDLRRSTFRWNTRYIWFENRKICNKLWVWYWYCALLCEFDIVRCCVSLILCAVVWDWYCALLQTALALESSCYVVLIHLNSSMCLNTFALLKSFQMLQWETRMFLAGNCSPLAFTKSKDVSAA